jgi:hypothetical protein
MKRDKRTIPARHSRVASPPAAAEYPLKRERPRLAADLLVCRQLAHIALNGMNDACFSRSIYLALLLGARIKRDTAGLSDLFESRINSKAIYIVAAVWIQGCVFIQAKTWRIYHRRLDRYEFQIAT